MERIINCEATTVRKIIAWTLAGILTALFIVSAINKFIHPEVLENMELGQWRITIAIGEIISALLFLFPKTNIPGTVLLSAFMGGAIIVHMMGDTGILMPSNVLILVWICCILRNPELIKLK